MLSITAFNAIPNGSIFGFGITVDARSEEEGINMVRDTKRPMIWVAVKGYGNDWAIYTDWFGGDILERALVGVSQHGQKIGSTENIMRCIRCSKEVLKLYRV